MPAKLSEILKRITAENPNISVVPNGEPDGEIIGTIKNPITKALWAEIEDLREEVKNLVPATTEEELHHYLENLSGADMKDIMAKSTPIYEAHEFLVNLFWKLVREELDYPDGSIAIREKWQVVKHKDIASVLVGILGKGRGIGIPPEILQEIFGRQ